jgi:serine/threonine protein kinase
LTAGGPRETPSGVRLGEMSKLPERRKPRPDAHGAPQGEPREAPRAADEAAARRPGATLRSDTSGEDDLGPELELCLEALSGGDSGAVERLCAARPERADEIRERVGMLLQMNLLPRAENAPEFPERLAEFRLLRRLGGGGMGVVYEAEQEPLGRTVALKLIRPEHLYFPRARERFRRETEAVARLAHPGIVAIHTVGEAAGVPYFAMELVEGATLASVLQALEARAPEHLAGADLRAVVEASGALAGDGASEAAALFGASWVEACTRIALAMCDALSHAHARGVLHRDIKPSNIAVTPQGRVVLLDFGLASSADELRLTVSGSALGSVLYMAPEQVAGRTADIDARTDVYALGVTLYELLTLRPPFGGENAEQTRAAILDGRPTSPRLHNRRVTRELEVVCLKALERDSVRRYATMADFGADLRAVLERRPIRARPPGRLLRAWRWAQRRPATVAALGSASLLVLGLPSGLYWQQRGHSLELERSLSAEVEARRAADEASVREAEQRAKAELEAREAEQVSGFLVELFGASDPSRSRGTELTARELLERGRERVERALTEQPEVAARMLERIGESYNGLNLYAEAVATLERAVELRVSSRGDKDRRTAFAKLALGKARRLAGLPSAVPMLREALDTLRELDELATSTGVNAHLELAVALSERGRAAQALELLEEARGLLDKLPTDARRARSNVLSALAVTQATLMDFPGAERSARESLELDAELRPGPHPARLGDLNSLASALVNQDKLEEAEGVYAQLLAQAREVYGADSVATALFELNQAIVLERRGDLAGAEAVYRRKLAFLQEKLGLQHPNSARALSNLGVVLGKQGRHEEVRELFEGAAQELADRFGPRHGMVRFCWHRAGAAHEALGEFEAAERDFREALAEFGPSDAPHLGWFEISLASLLRRSDATREEARAIAARWAESSDIEVALEAQYVLAATALDEGREGDALEHVDAGFERSKERAPRTWAWPALQVLRGRIALAQGRASEAWDDIERGARELRELLGPAHFEVRSTLAWAEQAAGEDAARAERLRTLANTAVR